MKVKHLHRSQVLRADAQREVEHVDAVVLWEAARRGGQPPPDGRPERHAGARAGSPDRRVDLLEE
eukprot:2474487-Lingulodinium_polyedra.AAC.1